MHALGDQLWAGRFIFKINNGEQNAIWTIIISVGSLLIGGLLTYKFLEKKVVSLEEEVSRYKFGIKSAYVKFGKTFEQYAPFTNKFTDSERSNFYFLGQPIDGIDKMKTIRNCVEPKIAQHIFNLAFKSQQVVLKV